MKKPNIRPGDILKTNRSAYRVIGNRVLKCIYHKDTLWNPGQTISGVYYGTFFRRPWWVVRGFHEYYKAIKEQNKH